MNYSRCDLELALDILTTKTVDKLDNLYMVALEAGDPNSVGFADIFKVFRAWCMQLGTIVDEYNVASKNVRKIDFMYRLCRVYPEARKVKWRFRTFGTLKKSSDGTYLPDVKAAVAISRNAVASLDYLFDERMYRLINNYHAYQSGYDMQYVVTLEEAVGLLAWLTQMIYEEIPKQLNALKNFDKAKEMVANGEVEPVLNIKEGLANLMAMMSNTVHIISLNIDSISNGFEDAVIKTMDDIKDTYVVKSKKPDKRIEEILKNSTPVGKMHYNTLDFDVYEMPVKDISCLNNGGVNIYVHKGFFKLPKGMQEAVLFHEIGHRVNGDFDNINGVIDERRLFIKFKKQARQYSRIVHANRRFRYAEPLLDDTELVYLLVELEADRFASRFVGKNIMKKSLTSSFDYMLDHDKKMSDLVRDYNKFRMKIRTKMI